MTVDREETLYHESARELARMVVELETTVDGLGQDNAELSKQLEQVEVRAAELGSEVDEHKTRYANAIKMIQHRQQQLNLHRSAYLQLSGVYSEMVTKMLELNESVRALKNVNTVDVDEAIDTLADRIDRALRPS